MAHMSRPMVHNAISAPESCVVVVSSILLMALTQCHVGAVPVHYEEAKVPACIPCLATASDVDKAAPQNADLVQIQFLPSSGSSDGWFSFVVPGGKDVAWQVRRTKNRCDEQSFFYLMRIDGGPSMIWRFRSRTNGNYLAVRRLKEKKNNSTHELYAWAKGDDRQMDRQTDKHVNPENAPEDETFFTAKHSRLHKFNGVFHFTSSFHPESMKEDALWITARGMKSEGESTAELFVNQKPTNNSRFQLCNVRL
ncbi:hypothetical protein BV898_15946 [Hypsibius exemplaris]|uniref:Uncharacterized protein n=1 Tax=Hypsibius exemplaris TaxID=2072580 RepID=A0A9X6NC66_HYPEX|nr:hypothetical protein BV898_15946 [Hypsibius exemplaris]